MSEWAKTYRGNKGVTWYNPCAFNGFLFLLREPDNKDNLADPFFVIEGNWRWLSKVIGTHPSVRKISKACVTKDDHPGIVSKYGNRLFEMLRALAPDAHLEQIAYANLNVYGGGKTVSKEYREIISDREKLCAEMERIFRCIPRERVRCIVTCKDIFEALAEPESICPESGFRYKNGITRTGKYGDIMLIEMPRHPSRSPVITGSNVTDFISD